jgi:hypothetical protein
MNKFRSKSNSNLNVSSSSSHYFEKLYDDANKLKSIKNRLVSNSLNEFSFIPKLTNNKKYKINSSFNERNQKLLKLKEELKNKIENEDKESKNKANFHSKEEIEKNNKKIVERLYMKPMEKMKEIEDKSGNRVINKIKQKHQIKFKSKEKVDKIEELKKLSISLMNNIQQLNSNTKKAENIEDKNVAELPIKVQEANNIEITDSSNNSEVNIRQQNNKSSLDLPLKSDRADTTSIPNMPHHISKSPILRSDHTFTDHTNHNQFKSRALLNLLENRKKDESPIMPDQKTF